jgi:hypothetical protein
MTSPYYQIERLQGLLFAKRDAPYSYEPSRQIDWPGGNVLLFVVPDQILIYTEQDSKQTLSLVYDRSVQDVNSPSGVLAGTALVRLALREERRHLPAQTAIA